MLIGWSDIQASSDAWQPSDYLLAAAIEKDVGSGKVLEARSPVPELLGGRPEVFQGVLSSLRLKMKYRVAVLSFHQEDLDVAAFNAGDPRVRREVAAAIDLFLETAFAGVPPEGRPTHLISTHTHLGRLEVNIALPRFVKNSAGKVRSFNPHPNQKGSRNLWDSLRQLLNRKFDWRDPDTIALTTTLRGPNWMEKRIAAANRNGKKFDPERDPDLYLLQYAKSIFSAPKTDTAELAPKSLLEAAKALGFELERRNRSVVAVKDKTGRTAFSIRRLVLNGEADRKDPATLFEHFAGLWRRRAIQNSKTFSKGDWEVVELDWQQRLRRPHFAIPSTHPECSSNPVNVGLGVRLAARLRELAQALGRAIAGRLTLDALEATSVHAFKDIRQKLENLSNDSGPKNRGIIRVDGGALRPASPGVEQRRGRSGVDADRRASVGAQPNKNRHGGACDGAGGS